MWTRENDDENPSNDVSYMACGHKYDGKIILVTRSRNYISILRAHENRRKYFQACVHFNFYAIKARFFFN